MVRAGRVAGGRYPVDRILIFAWGRHVAAGYRFSVAPRAERLARLAVHGFTASSSPRPPRRRRFAAGTCAPTQQPQSAPVGR